MTETNNREVNADTEVLDVEDAPEGDEGDDETIVSAEEIPKEGEEPEDTPESSPEEKKEAEGAEVPPKEETAPSQPAPVAGETTRETALRLEVQRVKGLLRKKSIGDMINGEEAPAAAVDKIQELRDLGYSDEDITNMEKAIDVIATKKGYVKAEHSYQATVNDTVEAFIEANPEFKPENDPEDVRWGRFQEILKDGIYNIQGKTAKQLTSIFAKVKEDVDKELGEPVSKTKVKEQAAQRQKIQSVSHSGGSKPTPAAKPKASTIDPGVRAMFKGFDEGDLD